MPRIYTSSNSPLDFCVRCFPKNEAKAELTYGRMGVGPDGRGNCFSYEADHPDYSCDAYQNNLTNHTLIIDDN